ncbi:MAG TPA: phosphotransferase family protein [Dehalococcoidia bacterium]|nr:phosphotransferase family protein [Dehalococcoidia bacterium]
METAPSRPLVDSDSLHSYLKQYFGEDRELRVERIISGKSNETFLLDWGEDHWVLRRPPAGPLPPSAHDVLREYRVLTGLHGRGVRAPRTILSCDDESVIGAPFYVMECVPGDSLLNPPPPDFLEDPEEKRRVGEQMVEVLAEVHAVDWRAAGLEGFGKPAGFVRRQVERRMQQLESIMVRCRHLPEMVEVNEWLAANLPPETDEPTIVHGDYGLHNVFFAGQAPATATAILDWELSTIGDPLTDVGWLTAMWQEPGDETEPGDQGFGLTSRPGYHTRDELVALYEERTGRRADNINFYRILSIWRLAIALEGTYARYKLGVTDNPYFATLEDRIPAMARRCLRIARGELAA